MQTFNAKKKKKIMSCSVKFIEYLFSAVNIVYFKPSVGSLPRIKMSLFLLSICTNKLLSTPNITTYLQNSFPFDIAKLPRILH